MIVYQPFMQKQLLLTISKLCFLTCSKQITSKDNINKRGKKVDISSINVADLEE
jgi:hypothetical protein